MPALLVAAAIITDGRGRILINQRPETSKHAGKWEFPGGKVKDGEDPRDALARECMEELGVSVEVGAVYETLFHNYAGNDILLMFYLVKVLEGVPRSMEDNPLAWVTPTEMATYDLLEADRILPSYFKRRFPQYKECYARYLENNPKE